MAELKQGTKVKFESGAEAEVVKCIEEGYYLLKMETGRGVQAHIDQLEVIDESGIVTSDESLSDQRCLARIGDFGRQCKNDALEGEKFCHIPNHKERVESGDDA